MKIALQSLESLNGLAVPAKTTVAKLQPKEHRPNKVLKLLSHTCLYMHFSHASAVWHRRSIDVRPTRHCRLSLDGTGSINVELVVPINIRQYIRSVSFDHILTNGFANKSRTLYLSLTPCLLSDKLTR
ncbi:hypothetical protein DSO57_1023753 [Entomophthora muscae]|uniref:Uncharacterized protein n=1 Tax=Entomophthora muscae TaxID=34485 RepID=A0ACC2RTY5_9FUNG|nr:hypothetical protein DSO57_1023753 [Entomophthora muscae]